MLTVKDLSSTSHYIQQDIAAYLDGEDDTLIDDVCNCIEKRIQRLIEKLEATSNE